ncbi:ABC-2 type transporter [Dactylonectria estremocensis]|uniref:ABC-2 type transporter n=1 Tax=Dactylonectria estremocensis TaxID=1079267 RepID=A0A9P9D1B1_9HYPO|nr:ABC-2 type transporter [Dactylonectria estremocensis]
MEPSPNEQSQASPATSSSHTSSTTPRHVKEGDEEADTLFMLLKSHGDFATLGEDERRELTRIATTLTHHQSNAARESTGSDGAVECNPALNPESDQFDLAKWLQHFVQQFRDQGHMIRRAGIAFRNLGVSGTGEALQLQSTVGDYLTSPLRPGELLSFRAKAPKQILHNFNGLVKSGELLIVLGRPGSGCSTLLKSMCGELHGLELYQDADINYNGIPQNVMMKEFKGEAIYNQEVDKHFPHLTVGQTLEFAASCRTPSHRIHGMSREEFCQYAAKVVMTVCGLSHTYNTKVGNDFIRGVSGGERKRVSIAEMIVAGAPLFAWDNSTRGLDSANALKFVQTLRFACDTMEVANAVAIYQASQSIYDLFDKATVLKSSKGLFERQGWESPSRQTTGDFLTSITNPDERQPRKGMEERHWRRSPEFKALQTELEQHQEEFPVDDSGANAQEFRKQKQLAQSKHTRPGSPYLISVPMQRIWNDKSATLAAVLSQIVIALVVGSIYYGQVNATANLASKGAVLFMAVLINALSAISEIASLYNQREIVEKHKSYAFYHPATEAIAGIITDIPIKFITSVAFNLVLYFLSGLRREAGPFFVYFLISYMATFIMAATVSQAVSLAGVLVLALVIYTGFVVAVPQMHDWFSWIRWINPLFYAFEILIANEFHGREFICSTIIPSYSPNAGNSWICSAVGAIAGRHTVNGDSYIAASFEYHYSHVWRNFGILMAFLIALMGIYFLATELNSATQGTAEALVFLRGRVPAHLKKGARGAVSDEEMMQGAKERSQTESGALAAMPPQTDTFVWKDIVYDIELKGEPRRLLDHISGWVKPGTLTALMGSSGAGKTTLLDALAQRTSIGVITGDMLASGCPLDASFQRKTGYVQQQDLHLETSTVRESLQFSALLRQPKHVSKEEKFKYVEDIIDMLNIRGFADAIVGVPGQGLNVEQRKLLTIAVELAAKPKLLLFLDEPTSGLDSQSSWSICALLRKLADAGQAVLCTIHQPSAILFQEFDRLLFLAKGGRTVYLGDIGPNSRTLLDYFETNGARECGNDENPAEYMLELVNGTGDWHQVWNSSPQRRDVDAEIEDIISHGNTESSGPDQDSSAEGAEFAAPFILQLGVVTHRVFQQYWRTPSYIFAKLALCIVAGLFIGFSFYQAEGSLAGMNNVLYAVQQIQPLFVTQRSLYEVRERPSKAYSWKAFLIANILVEIPYQILAGILMYATFYYPVVGIQSSKRQVIILLSCVELLIYASSFAHMTIAALPDAQTADSVVTLLSMMSLTFCGVLQSPSALPGFWTFMYRVSPFSYWVAAKVSTVLHDREVTCSDTETSIFDPPAGQTCSQYLADYLETVPGQLQNPDATEKCQYCSLQVADQYLVGNDIYWSERWRNFGII